MNPKQSYVIRKTTELIRLGINVPDWQRFVSDMHVKQLEEYMLSTDVQINPLTTNFIQPILPGCITICIDAQNSLYICDGQHRLQALLNIYNNYKLDLEIMCCDIKVKDENEAHVIFKIVNSNLPMKRLPRNVRLSASNQVVTHFQTKFPEFFKDTDNPRRPNLNARIFSDHLATVIEEQKLTASEAIQKLEWFNTILSKFDPDDDQQKKAKQEASRKGSLFIGIFKPTYSFVHVCFKSEIHVNDFLMNQVKTTKQKISKKLRDEVWKKYNGKNFSSTCYACNNILDCDSFECGHVIPESKGGETTILNLRPICTSCNRSCGITNLDEFKKQFIK